MSLFGPEQVYIMPAQARFADSLARGLLAQFEDPIALANVRIFLPNRRAIRAVADALLRQSDGKALILPRLSALGDIGDDDELLLGGDLLDLPPPLGRYERLLALLPLVRDGLQRLYARTSPFAEVLRYTRALLKIFDQLQYGDISKPDIAALGSSGEFAEHWQRILVFLDIALEYWPAKLAELGASDPVAYRIAQINALVAQWEVQPPATPYIAAGSTGTINAVRHLLKRLAGLAQGCLILPSVALPDVHNKSLWQGLLSTHPAYALKQLIDALDRTPDSIAPWPYPATIDCDETRVHLVHQAFLPAAHTYAWRTIEANHKPLANVKIIEAAHPAEEAQAIALAMRQVLDTPGATAALVTPDRQLARRVAIQLRRFDIDIDDSAGTPLASARAAIFMQLLCETGLQGCAPVPLLALLKHPLCQSGSNRRAWLEMVRKLDAYILRGPRPAFGLAALKRAARTSKSDITPLLDILDIALGDWLEAHDGKPRTLAAWVELHIRTAERLSEPNSLWTGDAGKALLTLLDSLAADTQRLTASDYALLLKDFLQTEPVRPAFGKHPRLFIWGPLEARLQRCDLMILAGLNEGVWPQQADVDPILNEAMRQTLGLPTTEFRIGQSAMDFIHALCAPQVLITRALKSEDSPSIASRFLQRLDAVQENPLPRDTNLLQTARGLDRSLESEPAYEPLPRPALTLRPRSIYVTDIERLRRNPYAFYARKILGLTPLEALDAEPGAADRGSRIHDALEAYFNAGEGDLIAHFQTSFADLWDRPQVQTLWMPRFHIMANWIAAQQDAAWKPVRSEHSGIWSPVQIAPAFQLRGRADRIDMSSDGTTLRIVDYKTGSPPSMKQVLAGFALQLPLLALIAEHGGFEEIEALPVSAIEAWILTGRDEQDGKISKLFFDRTTNKRDDVLARANATLTELITLFDKPDTAYKYKSGPQRGAGGDDYRHLARVDAWQGRRP